MGLGGSRCGGTGESLLVFSPYVCSADKEGRWSVRVRTPEGSCTPLCLTFDDGDQAVEVDSVWAGEVYVCAGQSNMEMTLRGYGLPCGGL